MTMYPTLFTAHPDGIYREIALETVRTMFMSDDVYARRWDLVEKALTTSDLKSDGQRLVAIGAIVNSRKPHTDKDVQRTRELAALYGWEPSQI